MNWRLATGNWELRVKAGAYRARAPKGQQVKYGVEPRGPRPRNILRALKGRTGTFAVVGV